MSVRPHLRLGIREHVIFLMLGVALLGFAAGTVLDDQHQSPLEAALLTALITLPIALIVAVWVARPLKQVTEVARRIGHGEIDSRVPAVTGHREIRELAETLDRLAKAVREQDELRRSTVADVTHELRGSLTSVLARVEALQDGIGPELPTALERLHQDVLRVNRLVGDVTLLAEAQRAGVLVRKRPIELETVVRDRVSTHAVRFRRAGIELTARLSPVGVDGDPERLGQIVDNLLSNALRYTDPGGRVSVTLVRRGDEAAIEVSDTGIGIEPEQLAHVFDRFWRAPGQRERAAGGTGVGLAVVADLARAHFGHADVISTPGRGSTFRVHLPLTAEPAVEETVVCEPAAGGQTVVRLRGALDLASFERARDGVIEAIRRDEEPDIVLDLGEVPFMDSAGLGVLVAAQAEVRTRGGHMTVVAESPELRRLLGLVRLDQILDLAGAGAGAGSRPRGGDENPTAAATAA